MVHFLNCIKWMWLPIKASSAILFSHVKACASSGQGHSALYQNPPLGDIFSSPRSEVACKTGYRWLQVLFYSSVKGYWPILFFPSAQGYRGTEMAVDVFCGASKAAGGLPGVMEPMLPSFPVLAWEGIQDWTADCAAVFAPSQAQSSPQAILPLSSTILCPVWRLLLYRTQADLKWLTG